MATPKSLGKINASPTKDFFVSMLTRDITLDDAILDLLDNCVDGILRNKLSHTGATPYKRHHAHITINSDHFIIEDNCGGIPWELKDYAFRMGRTPGAPALNMPTVGIYGIGMKRAIFKMGKKCIIETWNGKQSYEVEFNEKWLRDETTWDLNVRDSLLRPEKPGTKISVSKLNELVSEEFGAGMGAFVQRLIRSVRSHYSAIIEKGFEVKINNTTVEPYPVQLAFAESNDSHLIRPYIFETKYDGVTVFLAVGFTKPIASQDEQDQDLVNPKYDSSRAGWTIICNDRVVLYCDKSEQTGWGIGRIPKHHPQFNAISGVVVFESNDASKLPTVTTKRGLEMGSKIYLHVRERMMEGLKLFTDFTNKWKDDLETARDTIGKTQLLSISQIRAKTASLELAEVRGQTIGGKLSKPSLPTPAKQLSNVRRITFSRPATEISLVGDHLFGDPDVDPSTVGEKCFTLFLKEAKKK